MSLSKYEAPYWIRNSHIRIDPVKGPEKMIVNINKTKHLRKYAVSTGVDLLVRELAKDKNVIVACSTKRTVDLIEKRVTKELGSALQAKYYTSDGKGGSLADVNTSWKLLRLVVYSPTIPSGVSFTEAHFHLRMGFFENSDKTPTVDVCLQQLKRARCTLENKSYIYINDTPNYDRIGPIDLTSNAVDRRLERQDDYISLISNGTMDFNGGCVSSMTPAGHRVYETDNIWYEVLKGSLILKGQSLAQFSAIFLNALASDFGAIVTEKYVTPPTTKQGKDTLKELHLADKEEKEYNQNVECFRIPSFEELGEIKWAMKHRKGGLTRDEHQVMLNAAVAWHYGLWDTRRLDETFIKKYVGPALAFGAKEKALSKLQAFRHYDMLCQLGVDALSNEGIEWLCERKGDNGTGEKIMDFFADRLKVDKTRINEALAMMVAVFEGVHVVHQLAGCFKDDTRGIVIAHVTASPTEFPHSFTVKCEDVYDRLDAHLKAIGSIRYKAMVEAFDFDRKAYKEIPTERKRAQFIKKVLFTTFQLSFVVSNNAITISSQEFYSIVSKYLLDDFPMKIVRRKSA